MSARRKPYAVPLRGPETARKRVPKQRISIGHTDEFGIYRMLGVTQREQTAHVWRMRSNNTPGATPALPVRQLPVPSIELPMLVDKHAIAAYFGVSVRTVEDWRYNGIGPKPVKIGGALRWRAEDVLSYVEAAVNA